MTKLRMRGFFLIVLGFLFFAPQLAVAQWGAFLGGFADGYQRQKEEESRRKALELYERRTRLLEEEQRRLELERQQREMARQRAEMERQREAKQRVEEERQRRELAHNNGCQAGSGTGFFVSKSGHLITNAHVVRDCPFATATDRNGITYELDLLAIDKHNDLALMQASKKSDGLPIAGIGSVAKGLKVYAIGFPQVGIQGMESKITDGIISSMSGLENNNDWFQISVPIQGGNSGGPLVNESGSVVGVVVATAGLNYYYHQTGTLPQNVNFAIKTDMLDRFLRKNGVVPLKAAGLKRENPLDFVDQNTVLILVEPRQFAPNAIASPNGRNEPRRIAQQEKKEPDDFSQNSLPPVIKTGSEEWKSQETIHIKCRIGALTPVLSTKDKCAAARGTVVP